MSVEPKLSKEEIVALLMQSQKEAALFKERLEELQMHLFSRSTERMECLGQESMFNEAEAKYNEEENEPEIEKAVVMRSKRPRGKLAEDLKGLPTRKEIHELSEDELRQIFGEKGWKRLPDEVSWKLEYHPAVKEAVEHHTAVYASKNDDRIVRAPRPADLLAHSMRYFFLCCMSFGTSLFRVTSCAINTLSPSSVTADAPMFVLPGSIPRIRGCVCSSVS